MIIQEPNSSVLLTLQLEDGVTDQYPQAVVRDSAGSEVSGSPFNLTHVGNGLYTSTDWTPTAAALYSSTYIVYSNSGHSTENINYGRAIDNVFVGSFGGGGTTNTYTTGGVNLQANVINKKQEKFNETVKKALAELEEKLDLMLAKDPTMDYASIQSFINESIKEALDKVSTDTLKQVEMIDGRMVELGRAIDINNVEYTKFFDGLNERIHVLGQETKTVPNIISSMLNSFTNSFTSKFSGVEEYLTNLSKQVKDLDTYTSKFNEEGTANMSNLREEVGTKISKLQEEVKEIPLFIRKGMESLQNRVRLDQEDIQKGILTGQDKITESQENQINSFGEESRAMFTELSTALTKRLSTLKSTMDTLSSQSVDKDGFSDSMKSLTDNLDNMATELDNYKLEYTKNTNKLNNMLPKIALKRDLTYTQDKVNKDIKDLQTHNTRKFKSLKEDVSVQIDGLQEDIDKMDEETKKKLKELNNNVMISQEELDVNAQLDLIKGLEEKEDG